HGRGGPPLWGIRRRRAPRPWPRPEHHPGAGQRLPRAGVPRARLRQTGRDRHAVDCEAITAMTTSPVAATVPLPPPVARPHDAQLRQDVRSLAASLDPVVRRLAGDETLRTVADLRP